MKFQQLCLDHGIDWAPDGHRHYRPGWINVPCPFCTGSKNYHLGWSIAEEYFFCWRCGWHPVDQTTVALTDLPFPEVLSRYEGRERGARRSSSPLPGARNAADAQVQLKLPSDCGPLRRDHARYLRGRGLDPEEIERVWEIRSTGPRSVASLADYSNRILIPIYWEGRMVSYQCRATSPRAEVKYKACPQSEELIQHKTLLYRHPQAVGTTGICVEGVIDVWKLGPAAFATFGIGYAPPQVKAIAELYQRVAIVFDPEPVAQKQAKKLARDLLMHGTDVRIVPPPAGKDPGDLSIQEASKLVKDSILAFSFARRL